MNKRPAAPTGANQISLLEQRLAQLETINAISQASAQVLEFDALVELVGEKIRATFGVQSAYIALLDASATVIRIPYWVIREMRLPVRQFDPDRGLNGHILRSRQALIINRDYMRVSEELGVIRVATLATPESPKSWLGVPIFNRESAIGVIAIVNYDHEDAFSAETAQFLSTLAASLSHAFRNAQLYQALQVELKDRIASEEALRIANRELSVRLDEIEVLQARMRELSVRDALTGLYNRRYLDESVERELARCLREQVPLSVVMMDLDEFKRINDTHGHKAGDLMLQALGKLLMLHTRRSDVACRYGGEEFILLMPDASLSEAAQRAEVLRCAAQEMRVPFANRELVRTLSLGVASFPEHGQTSEAVIAKADEMLYLAKQTGRNRVLLAPV